MTEIDQRPMNGWDPPDCEYEPEYVCEECETEITLYDRNRFCGLCEDCYKESEEFARSLTMENVMGDGSCSDCKIPNFLAFVFSEEEMRDILLEKFSALPDYRRDELMREYAEEDIYFWADYMKGKK